MKRIYVKTIVESAQHLDECEETMIRSDKAISRTSPKANIMTKLISNEIKLKESYSREIYVGIVKKSYLKKCNTEMW